MYSYNSFMMQLKYLKELDMKIQLMLCSAPEAEQKYINTTCYFIGPVLAPAVHSSAALGAQLNATVAVTEVQDPWSSGAVLAAMQVQCMLKFSELRLELPFQQMSLPALGSKQS
jgi:hypothetical protein